MPTENQVTAPLRKMFESPSPVPGASLVFRTSKSTSVQPIPRLSGRGRVPSVLVFDGSDGSISCSTKYDDFSLTSEGAAATELQSFGVAGYVDLGFGQYLALVTKRELAVHVTGIDIWRVTGAQILPTIRAPLMSLDEEEQERVCLHAITSSLTSGHAYYSLDMNLSTSVQQAHLQELGRSLSSWVDADLKYVWNAYLLQPLLQSPTYHPFILPLIYGFVGLTRVNSCPVLLKSKMSRYRVGARYWRRGANALGDAVMDTVTETVVFHPDHVSAFVISRGSVPLYWRHKNVEPFRTPTTELSQTLSEASIQACRLHFMAMEREYGAPPTVIDLLKSDHRRLSEAYEKVVKEHLDTPVTYIHKPLNLSDSKKHFEAFLDINIRKLIVNQSYFQVRRDVDTLQESPLYNQEGVFRVNGFDCVDDTNIAQYIISQYVLQMMFRDTGKSGGKSSKLDNRGLKRYMHLWHQNGNALSVIYTGTLSMNHATAPFLTRSIPGRSLILVISRNYLNCFQDHRKQEDLNIVMGQVSENGLRSGTVTALAPQLSDAVKETQRLRIQFRKNVVQREFSQAVFVSTTFFVRAFLSPSEVNSVLQFIAALFWLSIHWILLRLGIERNVLIRRTQSTTHLDDISS